MPEMIYFDKPVSNPQYMRDIQVYNDERKNLQTELLFKTFTCSRSYQLAFSRITDLLKQSLDH